ncbi:uncharacterized protein LOC115570061 isoform X2 [Sparus aurata]|uniref:uncharacterized protein LOC115570061 isoform X2 n=1 Tax=Sparus aurata TaxID=8175 RepID=UPI0011C1C504|nr:uncharacterized protein LOC115570061 isoform X2 [Sparus aurata]
MRGLLSLSLMVFVLTESTKEEDMPAFGSRTATGGGGFNSTNNSTTNSTMATEVPAVSEVGADGVRVAISSYDGFRTPPANGEDTKMPQGDTAPTPTKKTLLDLSTVILLENEKDCPSRPSDGNVDQPSFGSRTLTGGGGFNSTNNSTTNSTMATEVPAVSEVGADGVRVAINSPDGFRTPPANGEDTKMPQGDTAPTPTKKTLLDPIVTILFGN